MSLKQEIETWVTALAAYDNNEYDAALRCFERIADTSKILFNTGVIHATLGEHTQAVDCYQRAVQLDQYLAVAYFQQGVSNFLMGDFEEALANFNDTLLYLRGNKYIDYGQLGLKFKLYSCEVLFNRGLCYVYLQQKDAGMQDMMFAAREKAVPDHDVIDEAIREQAEGYTVFSIPVGVVYRPNEAKVKNLKSKDYLGKARLVAQQDQLNVDARRNAALASMAQDDRPQEKLSYAALNLVHPELRSRSRLQSAPPLNRNVFPPTPPPETERPTSSHSKHKSSSSNRSSTPSLQQSRPMAKPLRLELGAAAFDQRSQQQVQPPAEQPRIGTRRAESERPVPRRVHSSASSASRRYREEHHRNSRRDIPEVQIEDDPIQAYSPQAYRSPPQQALSQQNQQQQQQQQLQEQHSRAKSTHLSYPQSIEEEDESDTTATPTESPLAFEIMAPPAVPTNKPTSATTAVTSSHRHRSHSRRAPTLTKIRLKIHAEDMRYVMTTPTATFTDLEQQIRAKFAFQAQFKLKIRDEEGDMVTMGDQDDWEMAVGGVKADAARDRAEMGKLEVWVQEI
nr:neutrophil cytosol factor 2 [Quercus suber]